jgi:hypothetical protein
MAGVSDCDSEADCDAVDVAEIEAGSDAVSVATRDSDEVALPAERDSTCEWETEALAADRVPLAEADAEALALRLADLVSVLDSLVVAVRDGEA